MDPKNALVKHSMEHHQDLETHPPFSMKVLGRYKTALQRQVAEAVFIDNNQADIIMNSKGEWNGSKLPRVVLEIGDKVNQLDYNNTTPTTTTIGQQQQHSTDAGQGPPQETEA